MWQRNRHKASEITASASEVCKTSTPVYLAANLNRNQAAIFMDDKLKQYRESINNIDAALVFMLAERFKITQAVGEYKAQNSLPTADPAREQEQIARLRQLASAANLDPEFSEKFLRFIIDEVIRHHERIREESN